MKTFLRKSLIVSSLVLGAGAIAQTANAAPGDSLRWQSVIGIAQANNIVGTGAGAVTGGGQPWSASGGHVSVDPYTGKIDFDVNGLVNAGGNAIGTPGAVVQVKGTLVCDTNGSASGGTTSILVDTPLVDLSEAGDAHFHGTVGALPAQCVNEPDVAFLIRAGSRWIANGTLLR